MRRPPPRSVIRDRPFKSHHHYCTESRNETPLTYTAAFHPRTPGSPRWDSLSKHKEQFSHFLPHASQIYRRMKEVYGEQCLSRCTIFRWCQRYEAGRVNIKVLPRSGQAHVVANSATISAVDELIRQNRRLTTREIAVELSISR
ncbi:hypothetical protein AVEN_45589-1 [Araneus ventricosus]|uniref:Mos1 transposase HTH domain-containing protein n=1 Tax=Araneus ventricosus TaxID=182803 RepID=A0A4Y2SQN9_ARAVE|nr:hypothetical protein AVEN_45589-1 [Araneus ventricosus]